MYKMTLTAQRKILMTIALPYANGVIHLGHMVEAIQADIWARFQKMMGNDCIFVCGSDAHGTAIMLEAEKQDITPDALVEKVRLDHMSDFDKFLIEFDNFYTSHSPENEKMSGDIYLQLKERGDISTKNITQSFDPEKNIFLADRFIKGTCPKCKAEDQYGDNCEVCGATYSPTDLINPKSAISGATPIEKESEHYFFHLENYTDLLKEWVDSGSLQSQVANKLKEWFGDDLRPWDISRDAPYFGFKIPGTEDKYFYVWLDAPVGYMASFQNLIDQGRDVNFDEYWAANSTTELHHFIGKDIMYFHALFWPAMLHGANFRLPTNVFVHGYLTINGEKMSKSRGTFITAKKYAEHLNPECLRYYFAAKLSNTVEDIDLSLSDFMQRVNSDLVGKYVNLASRTAGFITKKFDKTLSSELPDKALYDEFVKEGEVISNDYETLNYSRAVRRIMALADKANQYIDHHKPWAMAKEENQLADVQPICTQGLNLFRVLSIYLKPILPNIVAQVETFLNCEPFSWQDCQAPLLGTTINKFKPLLQRITEEQIEQLEQVS
jgi:methionyl-tRNA synthetase